jgi:hypothetical protein
MGLSPLPAARRPVNVPIPASPRMVNGSASSSDPDQAHSSAAMREVLGIIKRVHGFGFQECGVAYCVVRPRQKLQMTSLRTSQVAGGPHVVPVAFNRIVMLIGYADPAETFVTCPNRRLRRRLLRAGHQADHLPGSRFRPRFWVCCRYDGRAEEFSQIGKQDGTGPGFNLLAGPDWSGEIPAVSRRWSARPRRRCSRPRVFS